MQGVRGPQDRRSSLRPRALNPLRFVLFSKVAAPFGTQRSRGESSEVSTFSSTLVVACPSGRSRPSGCPVASPCGSDSSAPMPNDIFSYADWPFYIFLGQLSCLLFLSSLEGVALMAFTDGGRETGGEREALIHRLPPVRAWTGDPHRSPGLCPDWELNLRPFGFRTTLQPTEPHRQGSCLRFN